MNVPTKESKVAGIVYFVSINPRLKIGPYNTTFHFFEHDYKVGVKFWYGIADLACDESEIIKDAFSNGFNIGIADLPTFLSSLIMSIKIDDGRFGDSQAI